MDLWAGPEDLTIWVVDIADLLVDPADSTAEDLAAAAPDEDKIANTDFNTQLKRPCFYTRSFCFICCADYA